MKTLAAFLLVNAVIVALHGLAAGLAYVLGQLIIVTGLAENWLAWASAGILASGVAISVAMRMVRG